MMQYLLYLWLLMIQFKGVVSQSGSQKFHIEENRDGGVYVGTIGEGMPSFNPPFSIHITQQDVGDAFTIDENTGRITTKLSLDYEIKTRYEFLVSDQAHNFEDVVILVDDLNDNSPIFEHGDFIDISLPESSPKEETKIHLNSVTDADKGTNSIQGCRIISGNSDRAFRLSVRKGGSNKLLLDLIVSGILDRETVDNYKLVLEAYDGGKPMRVGQLTVNITILDVNDYQPVFNPSYYTALIEETRKVGSSVLEVSAFDKDAGENGKIRYSINRQKGDAEKVFVIDAKSGEILLNKALNFERKSKFQLIILATDLGSPPQEGSAVVSISIRNVNEKPPKLSVIFLTNVNQSADIAEDSLPGSLVARVSISDPDKANSQQTIGSQLRLSGDNGFFRLSAKGKNIYMLSLKRKLDREKTPSYNLSLTAVDSGSPPLTSVTSFTLYISDVNDNSPIFSKPIYSAVIQEVVPTGSSVIQVSASDADEGRNSDVTYSLLPSRLDWFDIDSQSGWIVTKSPLDCEVQPVSKVTVVATDNGRVKMSSSVDVTITIRDYNDNHPMFDLSVYTASVPENITLNSCILQVSATDPDCGVGAHVTYLIPDDIHFTRPSQFTLNATSGELCLRERLNYEHVTLFEFAVQAQDNDGLSSVAMVQISVEDINDHRPTFYPSVYNSNVRADMAPGTEIVTVQATDRDSGVYGRVHYTLVGSQTQFTIDAQSGVISLKQTLSLGQRVAKLSVAATDGGGLSADSLAQVTISVVSGDQLPPIFTSALYQFSVSESISTHESVGSVKANAAKGGVVYSIQDGDKLGLFTIDPATGDISTDKRLDHEQFASLLLNVQAESSNPVLFGNAQVNITIEDVNDNAPYFRLKKIKLFVSEAMQTNAPIYTLHATDKDSGRNGLVTYKLVINPGDIFSVHASTGVLSLKHNLDYESKTTYELTIRATDSALTPRTAQVVVVIDVQDANDNTPVFLRSLFAFKIPENSRIGLKFAWVNATDRDTGNNGQIVYRILEPHSHPTFGVFPSDGYLYLRKKLDREILDRYSLTIVATDNGEPPRSASVNVTIKVTDKNDNTPTFTESSYTFEIHETTANEVSIGQVTARDHDTDANSELTYVLVDDSRGYFQIDRQSGEIRSRVILDRETTSEHKFSVRVSDGGVVSRSAVAAVRVIVLDVNDNYPTFDTVEPASVDENQEKGLYVATIVARDADEGNNGRVSYSLHHDEDSESFFIHPNTGVVSTAEVLDYEVKQRFNLRVIASDYGHPRKHSSVHLVVKIRDDRSEITITPSKELSFDVVENSAVSTVIGRVNNDGRKLSYRLFAGNVFDSFNIDINNGEIFTVRVLDYEKASFHVLGIKMVDVGTYVPKTTTVEVKVNVLDLNDNTPVFYDDPVILNVKENNRADVQLYDVYARDLDSGLNGSVRYTIISQVPPTSSFVISLHGVLTTTKPLDYEASREVVLVIEAQDRCPAPSQRLATTMTVVVHVGDENDNSPVFMSSSSAFVREDEQPGSAVMRVIARDDDGRGHVRYDVVDGGGQAGVTLDRDTGLLRLTRRLDRETSPLTTLQLVAYDDGAPRRMTRATLTIHVQDVNDNAPSFTHMLYTGTVVEMSDPGRHDIVTVTATDRDIGVNAELEYFIADLAIGRLFSVHPTSGIITAGALDRESCSLYVFTVYVKDKGTPSLYDRCTVEVTVTDINDNAPTFLAPTISRDVPENTKLSLLLLATDADDGDNARLTYSIIEGDSSPPVFSLHPHTGVLTSTTLNREQRARHTLKVRVLDAGQRPKFAVCTVVVNVLDENDHGPEFDRVSYSQSVVEDVGVGEEVVTVTARDIDQGENGVVRYTLDDPSGLFVMDGVTGRIATARLLDRERVTRHDLVVNATDGALDGRRHASVLVTVQVTDINDNSPVFTQFPFTKSIPLNSGHDTSVTTVHATDQDAGVNAEVAYSLLDTSDDFTVESSSGAIKIVRVLSVSKMHTLRILATDGGSPAKSSTGVMEITVGSPPPPPHLSFTEPSYTASLDEHPALDTEVKRVSVSGAATYSIVNGDATDVFSIHSTDGTIRVHNPSLVDHEARPTQHILVLAWQGSTFGYANITVNIRDTNDHSPLFSQARYTASVREKEPPHSYVTQMRTTDLDSPPNNLTIFTINSGNIDTSFSIDATLGVLSSTMMLDREVRSVYHLVIQAMDRGSPPRSTSCLVDVTVTDVNDNRPYLRSFDPITIPEDTPVGQVIETVFATDVDLYPRLTYSFVNGGDMHQTFSIDRYTGEIILLKRVDYERRQQYALDIEASDEVHTARTTLLVHVSDVNDNAPTFQQPLYLVKPERVRDGGVIVRVTATDADSTHNARLTYSLTHPPPGIFIDSHTGAIRCNISSILSTLLLVTAIDHGLPPLSSTIVVVVTTTSDSDYLPSFLTSSFEVHVREDKLAGSLVSDLPATSTNLHRTDYLITAGNNFQKFFLNKTSGQIYLQRTVDRESVSAYSLKILAKNRVNDTRSSSIAVSVVIDDANDQAPVFDQREYSAKIDENWTWSNGALVTVHASDSDVGLNGEVVYSISSGNGRDTFLVSSDTGEVFVRPTAVVDYERRSVYVIVVKAMDCDRCDGAAPRLTAFARVVIVVRDINEFTPEFAQRAYTIPVPENVGPHTPVFRVHANDMDGGVYGQVTYHMRSYSAETNNFAVDSATGIIRASSSFDTPARRNRVYRFEVAAKDRGDLSTTVQVSAVIYSVDEYSPMFDVRIYNFSVPGNAKSGYVLGKVHATDNDFGPHSHVAYYIDGGNDYIASNRTSGVLYVRNDLQRPIHDDRSAARHRRSLRSDRLSLVVVADSGERQSRVSLLVDVDRSCTGCAVVIEPSATASSGLASKYIIAIIVSVVVVIILVATAVFMFVRRGFRKRAPSASSDYNATYDVRAVPPTTISAVPPTTVIPSTRPPCYNEILFDRMVAENGRAHAQPHVQHHSLSQQSRSSVSSGHGSVDEPDIDEEIQMITANLYTSDQSQLNYHSVMPDSGIQEDDSLCEPSAQNHKDYLARLGIDTAVIDCNLGHHSNALTDDRGHMFDIQDTYNKQIRPCPVGGLTDRSRDQGFCDGELPQHGATLSSIINSEEEYSGSYNWDYLLDWGPCYQPLADVFSEIARLKDEYPQIPEIQCQQTTGRDRSPSGPPPMISDTPSSMLRSHSNHSSPARNYRGESDRRFNGGHSAGYNHGYESEHDLGHEYNVSRHPKHPNHQPRPNLHAQSHPQHYTDFPPSPVSHSFTPIAIAPSFTPSLSPLATHSPSIASFSSPHNLSSGQYEGSSLHNSSGASTPIMGRQPSVVVFHSSNEREFRI